MQSYSNYVPAVMCHHSSNSPDSSGPFSVSSFPTTEGLTNFSSASASPVSSYASLAPRIAGAVSVKVHRSSPSSQQSSQQSDQHSHQHQPLYEHLSVLPPTQPAMLHEAPYSGGEFTQLTADNKSNSSSSNSSKSVIVQLLDLEIWKRFCEVNNEMIVTKSGRYEQTLFF